MNLSEFYLAKFEFYIYSIKYYFSQAEYEKQRNARKLEEAQKESLLTQGNDEKAEPGGWLPKLPERDEFLKKYRSHHHH